MVKHRKYDIIPTINKPTQVRRNAATAIDHIITNIVISVIQNRFRIMKIDVSDHFSIIFELNSCEKSKP